MKRACYLLGGLLLAACRQTEPAPATGSAGPATGTITPGSTNSGPKPVPSFTLPAGASVTAAVSFQNTSQDADSYKWDFGDNSASRIVNPTHLYAKPGTYPVTLRAYSAKKDSAQVTSRLVVAGPPSPVGRYRGYVLFYSWDAIKGYSPTVRKDTVLTITAVDEMTVSESGDRLTFDPSFSSSAWNGHKPLRPHYSFIGSLTSTLTHFLQREQNGDSIYIHLSKGGRGGGDVWRFYCKKL